MRRACFAVPLFCSPALSQPVLPFGLPSVNTGENPVSLISTDLDQDGVLDLVVLCERSLEVKIGLGGGAFREGQTHQIEQVEKVRIALGDVNGDGLDDIAFPDSSDGAIRVFLSDGAGELMEAPFQVPTNGFPYDLRLVDLDGDSDLDYAFVNWGSVEVRLNSGNGLPNAGVFSAPVEGISLRAIEIVDLDLDGRPDIVVGGNDQGALLPFYNDGSAMNFVRGADVEMVAEARSIRSLDVNGDAYPDLAVSDIDDVQLSILIGQPGGGLVESSAQTFSSGLGGHLAVDDLNGDGLDDIALSVMDNDPYVLLYNDGAGGFEPDILGTFRSPQSSTIADLDDDGEPDLAFIEHTADLVTVALGDGSERPYSIPGFEIESLTAVNLLAHADLNLDGAQDFVAGRIGSNPVISFLSGADGTSAKLPDELITDSIRGMAFGDLNEDGFPDIAFTSDFGFSAKVGWAYGDGLGRFGAPSYVPAQSGPTGVAVFDADGDDDQDIIITEHDFGTLDFYQNEGAGFFLLSSMIDTFGDPEAVAVADLSQDGRLDLVVTSEDLLTIHVADGSGGFLGPMSYLVGSDPTDGVSRGIAMDDFDGDGMPEIAVGTDEGVFILLNPGEVGLPLTLVLNTEQDYHDMTTGDFNGDGRADLATIDGFQVVVFLAASEGLGFTEHRFYGGLSPAAIEAVDLTRDGADDLVVGQEALKDIVILYSRLGTPCLADLSTPFGVLDFSDVFEFLVLFGAGDPAVDLAEPFGLLDFSDVLGFLVAFGAGCP